ncbi:phage tail tape measure C-terminal domain-containing protein [Hylemonella sp. W303a]|uniref:phage tail tape measure C-terminal domain-containing protein n=1 Tax=Hylemonella sp. W303a TaxID=3389873 RepID=UPI00396B16E1
MATNQQTVRINPTIDSSALAVLEKSARETAREYARILGDGANQAAQIFQTTTRGMEDAIVQWGETSKSIAQDFADSMVRDTKAAWADYSSTVTNSVNEAAAQFETSTRGMEQTILDWGQKSKSTVKDFADSVKGDTKTAWKDFADKAGSNAGDALKDAAKEWWKTGNFSTKGVMDSLISDGKSAWSDYVNTVGGRAREAADQFQSSTLGMGDSLMQWALNGEGTVTGLAESITRQTQTAWADYVNTVDGNATYASDLFQSTTVGMEDALIQWAQTGKLNAKGLADSMIKEMQRVATQKLVTGLVNTFLGMFNGGSSPDAAGAGRATAHTGGVIGSDFLSSKVVDPAVFNGAQRRHSGGLVSGEVPIIAQAGEGVFTPGQMKALGMKANEGAGAAPMNLKVEVINNNGSQVNTSVQRGAGGNGEDVLQIVIEQAVAKAADQVAGGYGPMHSALRSRGYEPARG